MTTPKADHHVSAIKTWAFIVLMVAWVVFKGLLAYQAIGDLGQPGWDYRPIKDVPGESAYAIGIPYHPLPYPQHIRDRQGTEEHPAHLDIVPLSDWDR